MAFDAENHVIDPKTGFMIDRETGHKVGLENKPVLVREVGEWPKWVPLHESQFERPEGSPPFSKHWPTPKTFFNRVNGEVTVLVEDEDEEARATRALEDDREMRVDNENGLKSIGGGGQTAAPTVVPVAPYVSPDDFDLVKKTAVESPHELRTGTKIEPPSAEEFHPSDIG